MKQTKDLTALTVAKTLHEIAKIVYTLRVSDCAKMSLKEIIDCDKANAKKQLIQKFNFDLYPEELQTIKAANIEGVEIVENCVKINICEFCAVFPGNIFYILDKFVKMTGYKIAPFEAIELKKEEIKEDLKKDVLRVVDYSEKAFALLGTSRELSEQLKAMGGRYNSHLSCGAGWIFSKKRLEQVNAALNIAC